MPASAPIHGELQPGLMKHPLCPAVLLLRLHVCGRRRCLPPSVQAADDQQPADSEQQQAHGQVDACAHRAWSLMASAWKTSTSSRLIVRATVRPPGSSHKNIDRERRVSISSRSTASSFGFSVAVNTSAKNSAFTASQPASAIVPGWVGTPSCWCTLLCWSYAATPSAIR
jgi:hypothetical protein